jgi:F0F1-type ATP synthase beta subunit
MLQSSRTQLDRLVPLLTAAATDGRLSDDVVETGIKVIDVMRPIRAGGSVAIASENGAGGTVVMEEIVRRIGNSRHPVTMFMLIPPPSELWPPSSGLGVPEISRRFSQMPRKPGKPTVIIYIGQLCHAMW